MNANTPSNESAVEEFRRRVAERRRTATSEDTRFILSIPPTSPERYISGIVVLNIPSRAGTGDWHQTQVFFRPRARVPGSFIVERGQENDPSAFLGDEGIEDVSEMLDSIGVPHPPGPVWAANHARAIADLVFVSIMGGGAAEFVRIDDWMPTDDDKGRVLELIQAATTRLDPKRLGTMKRWIVENLDVRARQHGRRR